MLVEEPPASSVQRPESNDGWSRSSARWHVFRFGQRAGSRNGPCCRRCRSHGCSSSMCWPRSGSKGNVRAFPEALWGSPSCLPRSLWGSKGNVRAFPEALWGSHGGTGDAQAACLGKPDAVKQVDRAAGAKAESPFCTALVRTSSSSRNGCCRCCRFSSSHSHRDRSTSRGGWGRPWSTATFDGACNGSGSSRIRGRISARWLTQQRSSISCCNGRRKGIAC